MSKRGDNIHKRKDGRWEGRYKKGRSANGSVLYGSVYGKTYKEVKEKMSARSKEPIEEIVPKLKEITFGEVLDLWVANNRIRLKGGTIHKYQNLIDSHIKPGLGMFSITELDATQINSFLEQKLTNGKLNGCGALAPSYVRSIMLVINAALKYAVREQMCLPLKSAICKPVLPKKELTILSLEEQRRLESALISKFNTTSAGIFISLHTGLRIGEICGLLWDDIDFNQKVIKVKRTIARVKTDTSINNSATTLILDAPKTKASTREIPISTTLLPVLMRLRIISPKGFVISGTSDFVQPRTFEYRYHKVLADCGISHVNFHTLRHTFATRCVEAGVDVKSLSEILGHANVGVTLNTYVHSSLEMKRAQLEKLSSLIA